MSQSALQQGSQCGLHVKGFSDVKTPITVTIIMVALLQIMEKEQGSEHSPPGKEVRWPPKGGEALM